MAAPAGLVPQQHGEMEEQETSAMLDAAEPAPRRHLAMLEACGRSRGFGVSIVALLLTATFAQMQWPGEAAPKRTTLSRPAAPKRFPLFYDSSLRGGAEPDPEAPVAMIRKLIESDYTWETGAQSVAQCTIDVVNVVSFLARVGVLASRVATTCPDPAKQDLCAVFTTAMVSAISWVGAFSSLMAQSCQHAVDPHFIDVRLLCSADITMILSDLLDVATVAQLMTADCAPAADFVNVSEVAPWLKHHGGPVSGKDFWSKDPVPGLGHGKKPSVAPRGALKFPTAVGRRLNGTAASFFAKAGEAHKKLADKQAAKRWRDESLAACTVDVIQSLDYIGYSVFLLRSATLSCPDVRACPVDILNVIATLSWVAFFITNSVIDCPETAFAGAGCARDIIGLTAGVANLLGSAVSLPTDCNKR